MPEKVIVYGALPNSTVAFYNLPYISHIDCITQDQFHLYHNQSV